MHTRAQLEELTSRIARDAVSWRAQGIMLGRWGLVAGSDKVAIHLRSPAAAAAQALYDAYGADWIIVSPEPYTQQMVFTSQPSGGGSMKAGP